MHPGKIDDISLSAKFRVLARLVMAAILFSLAFRMAQHSLPFQFLSPPLFGLNLEMPFRLFKYFQLDKILVDSSAGSIAFTCALFLTAICCFLLPQKNFLFIVFSILFYLYFLSYDMFTILHGHPLTAMVWITVPFWARRVKSRLFLWDGLRYYACFIYVVSFIYKILGKSLFVWDNGVNSVKWNVAEYLYHFPDTIPSKILSFSIAHPFFLNAGHLAVMLAEGLMVIGFFTKRYDRWLIWIPILVHLSTYLYSDVYFVEMLVLVFLFFNDKQVAWIQRKIPVLAK